jgi:hypothetical protein
MGQSWRGGKDWGDKLALLPRVATSLNRMAQPNPIPPERAIALVMRRNWSKNPRDPLGRGKKRWGADLSQLNSDFMEKVQRMKSNNTCLRLSQVGKIAKLAWDLYSNWMSRYTGNYAYFKN